MTSWLVIGGGDMHGAQSLARSGQFDKIIGCNRCLQWGIVPDAYWISDPNATERYRADWTKYQGEIISNNNLGRPVTPWPYLHLGMLHHGRSSGIMCIRVALARGATTIHIVGFTGQKPTDRWRDQFDKPQFEYGDQAYKRNKAQSASLADIDLHHPAVSFVWHGNTLLTVPERWTLQ